MSIGLVTLVALAIAIVISCISPINIGFISIAFAYLIGVYMAGMPMGKLMAGFPINLFLILTGVTLLFSQAQVNGTLEKLTKQAMRLARGQAGLLPIIIFLLITILAGLGPGNIAMIALMAPIGMAVAGEARIPAILMAIMIVNGANAGAFSPIAPTGIVSNMLTAKMGMPDISIRIFFNSLWANIGIGILAYFLFGGLNLWRMQNKGEWIQMQVEPFDRNQWITLGGIALLLGLVLLFKVNVGMAAFVIAVTFSMFGIADEEKAVKAMPWNAILMVCGVSLLMEFANASGGLDLFTTLIAKVATPSSSTAVLGFLSGLISAYSSSSGVVMPTFIPLVPGLIAKMGGGDAVAMVSAINVGSHVVDASPLSIGGALCIACAASWVNKRHMFRQLMAWGLSMSVIGALTVWLLFTVLGI